jgi:hypothetical protein
MQLVDGFPFTAINNACGTCNTSGIPGQQSVDVGYSSDALSPPGDLFMCQNCVGEAARLLGYISPHEVGQIVAANIDLDSEKSALLAQNEALRGVIRALAVALATDPELALEIAMECRGKTWSPPDANRPAPAGEVVQPAAGVDVGAVAPT